jgi:UDP-glucose 4-epimerase
MKVLITGGAGYIGSELAYKLAENKAIKEIIIYDNLQHGNFNFFIGSRKLKHSAIRFIKGDILDGRKLKKSLEGVDVVYHLAANVTTPFADQNPHFFEQVNHWGTAELTYAIEQSSVSKLIYLSSVSVYGSREDKVNISSTLNPRTFYGISKKRGEEHVLRLFSKIPTYIVRSGNVFGFSKSLRIDAVINKFMFDAQFSNRITINGDGNQYRAFIEIGKVVRALDALLTSDMGSDFYNLVDKNLTVLDIAEVIKELYPELEMIFVNQHLKMREIQVERDERMQKLLNEKDRSLNEELSEFKKSFTF